MRPPFVCVNRRYPEPLSCKRQLASALARTSPRLPRRRHCLRSGAAAMTSPLKDGSLLAMVNLGRGAVASGLGMTQLLANVEQNFASLEPRTNHHWEEALAQWGAQSLDALCWQLGQKMAQRIGLAPWLHDSTPYRLISWPDFGAIGNDRLGFKLAAQMSKRPLSVTQLSEISGASPGLIVSFLNSVSLCGLLVAGPGAAPAVVARRPPASARLSMISRLRTRLGL